MAADTPYFDRLNDIGFAVLAKTEDEPVVALSPVALAHSLAVLMNGSSGKTRDELLALFKLTESNREAFNSAQRALLNQLALDGEAHLGTGLFAVWPVVVDAKFAEGMGAQYGATVRKLGGATMEGQRLLDTWARETSHGAIGRLDVGLTKDQQLLSASLAALETSYEYVDGTGPFPLRRYEDDEVTAVRYSLVAKGLSIVFLAPQNGVEPREFAAGMSGERFRHILESMEDVEADIQPPSISVSSTTDYAGLIDAPSLFGAECNLRLVSIELERGFSVSAVPHSVSLSLTSNEATFPPQTQNKAAVPTRIGYPNVFAVVDDATGAICFLGCLSDRP